MENQLVKPIIAAMLAEIEKHNLEIMRRYPNDLLVHDAAMLEIMAVPGAQIAWMTGHSHTHNVVLGLHAEENQNVRYLTNMGIDDRFYIIKVFNESFTIKEISRVEFSALSNTAVRFEREGNATSFWLKEKSNTKVGFVANQRIGSFHDMKVETTLTTIAGISGLARAALQLWASKSAVEMAHSLFVQQYLKWGEEICLSKVA